MPTAISQLLSLADPAASETNGGAREPAWPEPEEVRSSSVRTLIRVFCLTAIVAAACEVVERVAFLRVSLWQAQLAGVVALALTSSIGVWLSLRRVNIYFTNTRFWGTLEVWKPSTNPKLSSKRFATFPPRRTAWPTSLRAVQNGKTAWYAHVAAAPRSGSLLTSFAGSAAFGIRAASSPSRLEPSWKIPPSAWTSGFRQCGCFRMPRTVSVVAR